MVEEKFDPAATTLETKKHFVSFGYLPENPNSAQIHEIDDTIVS
jgi:hypothetical protein